MTDPTDDDEAFSWAGDDELRASRAPAPRLVDDAPVAPGRAASGGGFALLSLGLLGGVAVIETVFWARSAFQLQIAASLTTGGGSPVEIASFVVNLLGRVLAVASPLVWFGLIGWRVRAPSRRLALLVVGAVLLVPWPAILAAT